MSTRAQRRRERVLDVFRASPDAHHYGYDTSHAAHVRPFWLYRILDDMVAAGLIVDGWDDVHRDPLRRFYMLTDRGKSLLESGE